VVFDGRVLLETKMPALLALVALLAAGCARVRPWQRSRLASVPMVNPLVGEGLEGRYRAKVLESKTGGGAPGIAPGGGCGCTQ
jgi:hypothetical protein